MNKNTSLIYFTSRAFLLGLVYSSIISLTMQDSIICLIIGTLLGLLIIYLLHKINTKSKYFKAILFISCLIFIIFDSAVLEIFTSSFFLINTPKIVIIIPSILICLYTIFKENNILNRLSLILFILSLTLIGICFLSLIKNIHIDSILPMFISNKNNMLKAIFNYAITTSYPHIVLSKENISLKDHLNGYIFSNIINLLILIIILTVLTPRVAKIYSFPEYIVLKRIKILNFIENIENLMASIWYLDLYIFMCLTYKNIYEIVKRKSILTIIVITLNMLITLLIFNNYDRVLYIYNYYDIILGLLFILIIPCIKKE